MRPQPSVDARPVEGVAALGQEPESLVFFEFFQANGALCCFNQSISGSELENRNGIDHRLFEASSADLLPPGVVGSQATNLASIIIIFKSGSVSPRRITVHARMALADVKEKPMKKKKKKTQNREHENRDFVGPGGGVAADERGRWRGRSRERARWRGR